MPLGKSESTIKANLVLENSIKGNVSDLFCDGECCEIRLKLLKRNSVRSVFLVNLNNNQKNFPNNGLFIAKTVYNAQKTYELLELLFDKYNQEHVSTIFPKIYAYNSEYNYIIMEYIGGTILLKRVLTMLGMRSYRSLAKIFSDIGISLARFHNIANDNKQRKSLNDIVIPILEKINETNYFSLCEKEKIRNNLIKNMNLIGCDCEISITRLYNDWTIRNMVVTKSKELKLIDPDAMIHPNFPKRDTIWNDISTFIINIESLSRFYPFFNNNHLYYLNNVFLNGYFSSSKNCLTAEEINFFYYFTVLKFYLGLVERPLEIIYRDPFSSRYIKKLKTQLISGTGSIFGNNYALTLE